MRTVKDPVCGTRMDPEAAAGNTIYESQKVFFCSDQCRRDFEANPAHYYYRLERIERRPHVPA